MQKETIVLNGQCNKIVNFIENKKGEEFTPSQVVLATNIPWGTVSNFLFRKHRQGCLFRRREGKNYFYKQRNEYIPLPSTPKGMIADCVWEVLCNGEIVSGKGLHQTVGKLMLAKGVQETFSKSAIYKIMSILFKNGYLEKMGTGHCYEEVDYHLRGEYWRTSRPPITGSAIHNNTAQS